MNITKKDLIDQLVEEYRYTKQAAQMLVDDFTDVIIRNYENGNTVSIHGFGSFDMNLRAARNTTNPATGDPMNIPEHWVPKFTPGRQIRMAVRKWQDDVNRGLADD